MLLIFYYIFAIPVIIKAAKDSKDEISLSDSVLTSAAIILVGMFANFALSESMEELYFIVPYIFSFFWFLWYLKLRPRKALLATFLLFIVNYQIAIIIYKMLQY